LGVFDKGETPSGDETADASQALNVLINEYAGVHGADIFLRAEITLFIQEGQAAYSIGQGGDHATESYVETTLSGSGGASDTALSVTSSAGMTAADHIGIKLDDGSIHWTTISTVNSSILVTVATGLASAAASGNAVYAYTTKAFRPYNIFAPYRRSSSGTDTIVRIVGEAEYRGLSTKASEGVPNSIHYKASLTNGTLNVWPTGDGQTDKLCFVAHYRPDDFDSASDNAEFPLEWSSALIWGLAAELSPEYGLPEREQVRIYKIASMKLDNALNADIEGASVIFGRSQ